MLFLTRWFGVTGSDAERTTAHEQAVIAEITEKVLVVQERAAREVHQPLRRGTHAKGTCVRAQFEVFDVSQRRIPVLANRLAKGIFAKPGVYPAVIRFGNSDAKVNSDFKPDVRSLSFSVELAQDGTRQDFSLQNATTLPINDSTAFLAIMKVLAASKPGAGLLSLPFKDKLRVARTLLFAQIQSRQKIQPYQKLRYWSNVPFRHGPTEAVKFSATPSPQNPVKPLQKGNPDALQDELIRHVNADETMSYFDFGVQFLDAEKMTYWGKHQNANFWIENASVEWHESESPFHTLARLTFLPKSSLTPHEGEATYFDVTGNSHPESEPIGSINRARQQGEVASRKARLERAIIDDELNKSNQIVRQN